ncbi:DUF2802 domain-containing protein [Steroidobacter sp.]|uniref:DUF2802 domain-containing protein n=1 Tax=Steroidobacter sp. TaxID=1978227 RepID=UPI001A3D249F|nr:DUF2802 domain-containing protein [Steroidobacter sp.]MBL8266453.1 DUF2802 domain-containing protein [Steroidobacter sp.]
MFEILPNPSLETLLIAGRAVALIGAFWVFAVAFSRWRRSDERESQALRAQLERAFGEMRSLHETVTIMSARIEAMSERAESESRRPQMPAVVANPQARGYDLAMRMAKNGSAPEEMVANCGITRHEAELLTRLHAAKAQPEVAAWNARQQERQPVQQPQVAEAPQQQPQATGRKRGSLLSVVG